MCGYDAYVNALQFHHLDPAQKASASPRAADAVAAAARTEAAKCVLLCANCHAEVEAGLATIAPSGPADYLDVGAGPRDTGRG